MSTTQELNRLIWAALVAFGVFQLLSSVGYVPLGEESSLCVGLGHALAESFSYSINSNPHSYLPPVYPSLLAGLTFLSVGLPIVYFGLNILLATLALVLCFELVKKLENQFVAVVGVFLLVTSPFYFQLLSGELVADFSFFCLFSAALFFAQRLGAQNPQTRKVASWALLFLLPITVMSRLAGIALAIAAVVKVLEEPNRLSKNTSYRSFLSIAALLSFVLFGVWTIRNAMMFEAKWPGQYMFSYWHQFNIYDSLLPELGQAGFFGYLLRPWEGLIAQGLHFSALTLHLETLRPLWYSPLVLFPLACVITGLRESFRAERFVVTAVASYLAMMVLWPEHHQPRFLIPVYPFLMLYTLRGAASLMGDFVNLGRRAALLALILGSSGFVASLATYSLFQKSVETQDIYLVVFWLFLSLLSAYWIWKRGRLPSVFVRFSETIKAGELPRFIGVIAAGLFMLLFGTGIVAQSDIAAKRAEIVYEKEPLVQIGQWLSENTASGAVIVASSPVLLNRLSKRNVVEFPIMSDADALVQSMVANKAEYLVINNRVDKPKPTEELRYNRLVSRYPSLLIPKEDNENAAVYRVNAAAE